MKDEDVHIYTFEYEYYYYYYCGLQCVGYSFPLYVFVLFFRGGYYYVF